MTTYHLDNVLVHEDLNSDDLARYSILQAVIAQAIELLNVPAESLACNITEGEPNAEDETLHRVAFAVNDGLLIAEGEAKTEADAAMRALVNLAYVVRKARIEADDQYVRITEALGNARQELHATTQAVWASRDDDPIVKADHHARIGAARERERALSSALGWRLRELMLEE